MAARATWKGFLKISLVNIPIKVFPATESAGTLSFNQLHGECRTRIQQKRWCPHCDREVPNAEIVKGYEFEKGRFVVLDEADFEKVRPGVDPGHQPRAVRRRVRDRSDVRGRGYYLAPDGAMAAEAFAVMREGMQGKVGVGKLALYGREYLVAVRPQQDGHRDVHAPPRRRDRRHRQVDELRAVPATVKPDEMKLARQVIGTFEGPLDLTDYRDEYREGLQRDHRREDRRRGDRRAGGGGAAEGREPDGGAPEEPRRGQRREEEAGQGDGRGHGQRRPSGSGRDGRWNCRLQIAECRVDADCRMRHLICTQQLQSAI